MLRRVVLVRTDVSEECSASIIRVIRISELGTTLAVTSNRSMSLMTCILIVRYRCFGGTCCCYHQCRRLRHLPLNHPYVPICAPNYMALQPRRRQCTKCFTLPLYSHSDIHFSLILMSQTVACVKRWQKGWRGRGL
jgi:hypothetical protein